MNSLYRNIHFRVILLSLSLMITTLNAQETHPPFDVNKIIGQVSRYNNFAGSRDGEFLIDTTITYTSALYAQRNPAIAFDGTNFFVVWPDRRFGSAIYGTRVTQSGTVLDPAGQFITSTGAAGLGHVAITFDGANYFIVWRDYRNDPGYGDIYGARVSPSGTVLDPEGIPIATDPYSQMLPSVVSGSTNYLVVWYDIRNGYGLCGARVSQSGILIDTSYIIISAEGNFSSVSFDGTNYLVVWDAGSYYPRNIYGARVSQSGILVDSTGIPISTSAGNQIRPSVAFDGTNFLVEWEDDRNGDYDIYAARVTQDGIILDTAGIAISTALDQQDRSSVNFDGTNYLVVWDDYRNSSPDIYGARVTPAGTILDPAGVLVSSTEGLQWSPKVAFGDTNYLVVWEDDLLGFDVYGARVTPAGAVLDTQAIIISTAANYQYYPSVAFDGTNYLVLWQDMRKDSDYDIYGMRVDSSGNLLDSTPIAVVTEPDDQRYPAVTFGSAHYLAVWSDGRNGYGVSGTRISPSGTVLDTNIVVTTEWGTPLTVFDGTNYFVVWHTYYGICGRRVNEAGVVIDTNAITITTSPYYIGNHSVAFDSSNYLVVWEEVMAYAEPSDIYGARVSHSGVLLDTAGIPISTQIEVQEQPVVAFDGTNYLVVWADYFGLSMRGARVSQAGIVLDTVDIFITVGVKPAIVYDGLNYIILFSGYGNSWDIYGVRIDTSVIVIDSFVVCAQPGSQYMQALALGAGGQFLVTYSGWTDSISGQPVNTMRTWGKFYPFVGIEEETQMPNAKCQMTKLMVYPNPFSKLTQISFGNVHSVSSQGDENPRLSDGTESIELKIYDATGRLVRTFPTNLCNPNESVVSVCWDGRDDTGKQLPSGVYFLKFAISPVGTTCSRGEAGEYTETKKLLLIK